MEPQVSLDCGASLHTVNIFYKEGSSGVIVASSSQDHVAPKQPAKKQTRQWAAWTRQEEESFFTALRQVGKNFEKITYRVQSKNKDQVRHYYYRLVRRMNKLLGPELCLDAKNSKDTNAAMLRWWSLLEKYSCKASKLHLKPRRFKIFLDTLEHQLLKDRRKNIRKRHAQVENCPTTASATVFGQGKALGNDSRADKVVVDSQNIQKSGSGKGSSLKRNANIGINRSNCKGDSVPLKTARPRRKPGTATTTAAYKRWEKAAIAGVSLVADAAEHLERTSLDEVVEHVQGEKGMDPVGKVVPSSPTSIQNLSRENSAQTFKLKLQLFPIDETTRKALEMDNHNPHLELTLSTRKKISSVVEHLNRKWGKSSIACGELVLLPFCVQWGNLVSCQRWTQDSVLSAADVYAQIGSPSIFRLRYCWLSNAGHETCQAPLASPDILDEHRTNMNDVQHQNVDSVPDFTPPSEHVSGNLIDSYRDQVVSAGKTTELASSTYMPKDMIECVGTGLDKNILDSSDNPPALSLQRETCSLAIMRQVEEKDEMRLQTGTALTPGEWADSLTNISMGDLLSEASDIMDTNCTSPSLQGSSQYLQQVPFSCDSFDAAIAALIYKHQDKTGFQPTLEFHAPSSIWDAEETCDAFSFQKNSVSLDKVLGASTNDSPESCEQSATRCLVASGSVVEEFPEMEEPMDDDPNHGDPMDEFQPDPTTVEDSAKYLTGLSDLYWSEYLGPLDLDIPSCKYHNEDQILSDSMSGLNRLIASSLDAFQNCSFFGLDKKESASTVEARESASLSDCKIGTKIEISKV